ncbi:putative mucin TcMUCII [Trypanosoma cruzi]|nr:putative mucin TcMUCII [Trypanosoma cruzi]
MMTTCRLQCALLVLALCCCPPVCVKAETREIIAVPDADTERKSTSPSRLSLENIPAEGEDNINAPNPPSIAPEVASEVAGQSILSSNGSGERPEKIDEDGQGLSDPGKKPNNSTNELRTENNNGTTGSKNGTSQSADQTDPNAKDPAATTATTAAQVQSDKATTTTTTEAPSKTTTTKAPRDTTTKPPTTTTTRAPSRLREMDGSLSSSAWMCAPLLLAVSALAYTTLG